MSSDVKIRILAQDLASPSIQRVVDSLRSLKSEGNSAGHSIGHSLGQAFGSLQQSASKALDFIRTNVMQNGVFAFQQLSREAFDSVTNFERLSIMLKGMVARDLKRTSDGVLSYQEALQKAGGATQELLQWIENLAIRSPYATSAVTSSFAQMTRYGFPIEEAKTMTRALLDMGAGSGLTADKLHDAAYALGQIFGSDKLRLEELNQLRDAGIDVKSILDRMGESFESLKDKQDEGGVSTKAFLEAFKQVASEDYAGNLDLMTQSWAGLAGALQDVKEVGLRKLFQGVLEVLQPLVSRFTDWVLGPGLTRLESIGKSIGTLAEKLIKVGTALFTAGPLSTEFAESLGVFGEDVKKIYEEMIMPALESLKNLGGKINEVYENVIKPAVEQVVEKLKPLGEKIRNAWTNLVGKGFFSEEFRNSLYEIDPTLGSIYDSVKNTVEKFQDLGEKIRNSFTNLTGKGFFSKEFRDSLYEIDPTIGRIYDTLSSKLKPVIDWMIQNKGPLLEVAKTILAVLGAIALFGVVSGILAGLGSLLSALISPLGLVIALVGLLALAWHTNFAGMRDQLTALYQESILPTFESIKQKFSDLGISFNNIGIDWKKVWDFIVGYLTFGFINTRHMLGMILALIRGDFDAFKMHLREWLINIGEKIVAPIIERLTGMEIDMRKVITGFGVYIWMATELLKYKISNAIETLKERVINIFVSIYDSVSGQINRLGSVAEELVQKIKSALSLSKFVTIGKEIIDGIIKGVLDNAYKIATAFNGALIPAIDSIKALLGISSPSKVFAEIGQQMAAGLSLGYQKGLENLQSVPVLASTATSPTQTVSVNVVINAQINSELDLQTVARKVAEEIRLRALQGRGSIIL